MKATHFQIGDKVVLKPGYEEYTITVPPLVPGRVYCVERINVLYGNDWLRLVGVREHKRKCCDDRGPIALAFRLVGQSGQRKEAA